MKHEAWRRILVSATLLLLVLSGSGCKRAKPPRTIVPPTSKPIPTIPVPTETPAKAAEEVVTPTLSVVASPKSGSPTATSLPPTLGLSPTRTSESPTATPTPTGTAPSATATAVPAPSGEVTYKVRGGDTLLGIAVLHKTTVGAILRRNNLTNPDKIYVGQTLIIPLGQSPSETPTAETIQHTVVASETLSQIARRYGTTTEAILRLNPSITDPEGLAVGTVLTITVGTSSSVRTHTVRPGETLFSIATKYGISLQSLVKANALVDPNRIFPGQALIIPE